MSLESIALIGILTLFTVVLGVDVFSLLMGRSVIEAISLEFFNVSGQFQWAMGFRLGLILFFLLLGAITINLAPTYRTEEYLLKIGLSSLLVYLGLFVFGMSFLSGFIAKSVDSGAQFDRSLLNTAGWYNLWTLLLWSRAIAALVSFWSFLHYAMNPKL